MNHLTGYDCVCQTGYDVDISESEGCWAEPHQVNDFINFYKNQICKVDFTSDTLLECLQNQVDTPRLGYEVFQVCNDSFVSQDSVGTYSYSYTDVYGDAQTRTYNWGGERNFIEHVTNFFDSSYSCLAIEETNYAWHGGHTGHSNYANSDNKFHTTTSFDIDTDYGSIFCNPHTLDSRNDILFVRSVGILREIQ